MATLDIKAKIEQYFIDNWTLTPIQLNKSYFNNGVYYEPTSLNNWISLKYVPVINNRYAFDGTSAGRIRYNAQLQVFCYAKTEPLAYQLEDDVKDFLHDLTLDDVEFGIGQDRSVSDLDNNYYEGLTIFEINQFS